MNESKQNILDKINRNDGMTVPEGFFKQFAEQMENQLPELSEPKEVYRPLIWQRLRPYVYMAAMFAGIYLMMEMFSAIKSPQSDLNLNNYPTLTATLESSDSDLIYEYDDYDLMEDLYNNGITASDLFDEKMPDEVVLTNLNVTEDSLK